MKFIKYPKIKNLGTDETYGIFDSTCVIQEKVDGANFHFWLDEGNLVFGSRNKSMEDKKDPKGWSGMVPVLSSFNDNPELFNQNYQYYGESMQKHTIAYSKIPNFVGYDIWDKKTEQFLDWKIVRDEFTKLNLPFIHVHFERDGSEITVEELNECIKNSAYKEGESEGIVIKNYDRQTFAKIVTDSFKEKNRQVFKGNSSPPKEGNSTIIIASTYSTDARIEKTIHKLIDEGNKLDMSMIPILFNAVAEDMFEENAVEIYHTFDKIDFKHLRGIVAKKCVSVLKRVLLERAI